MSIICFGDSFTSAENNSYNGWVEYINPLIGFDIINLGVSGTTFGQYSLYPVGDMNLIDLITKNEEDIKIATKIILSYGLNDIASEICGYVSMNKIKLDIIKCVDYIKQINPKISIIFLFFSNQHDTIYSLGKNMIKYLTEKYIIDDNIIKNNIINIKKYANHYLKLKNFINKRFSNFEIIYMFDKKDDYLNYLDDSLHPNDLGYQIISKNIYNQLVGEVQHV